MTLLGNRILAQPVVPDRIGSVFLPESMRAGHVGGYKLWDVLQTGPGRVTRTGVRVPVEAQPGDRIVTNPNVDGTHQFPDGTAILEAEVVLMVVEIHPRKSEVVVLTTDTNL